MNDFEKNLEGKADDFSKSLGLKLITASEGECQLKLRVEARHLNRARVVHGGVLMTALDTCMGAAGITTLKKGEWIVTLQLNTQFLTACREGDELTIKGKVVKRGNSILFIEGEVLKDSKPACKAAGEWFVIRKP